MDEMQVKKQIRYLVSGCLAALAIVIAIGLVYNRALSHNLIGWFLVMLFMLFSYILITWNRRERSDQRMLDEINSKIANRTTK